MLGGYRVLTASDGIEALRHIDGYQPSAVVLDLGLPLLSGRDVGRELHENLQGIPVVVVTGSDAPIDEQDFPCVLRKPVTANALIEAVDNCLRRDRIRD